MIETIEENLRNGIALLASISDEHYSDKSVPPYFSSIGCHIRHVLDAFKSILDGVEKNEIDFTNRLRNTSCEEKTVEGIAYFNSIISRLHTLDTSKFEKLINVTDDLGSGKITIKYTLASTLLYAHSHAIHHFASIGFLINQLKIELPEGNFGYNPTTPKILVD